LGLNNELPVGSSTGKLSETLINEMLQWRVEAKNNKNYALADEIRNRLTQLGIVIKDTKDGFEWELAK
jgi:cysteinyl-tRNA synthetase